MDREINPGAFGDASSDANNSEFDQYADSYKQLLSQSTGDRVEDIEFYPRQKVRILRSILADSPQPLRILDYGCGIGLSLPHLQASFRQSTIYASDPSAKSLEIAAANAPAIVPISYQELRSETYRQSFDLIFVSCVFHHIDSKDHIAVLAMLLQLTAPGGRLVIAEHNPWNPVTQRMVNTCPFDEGVTLISLPTLKKRLQRAGWSCARGRYMSFVPASLRQLAWLDLLLGWCPLGGQYMAHALKG